MTDQAKKNLERYYKNKASGKFRCELCARAYASKCVLERHYKSKKHQLAQDAKAEKFRQMILKLKDTLPADLMGEVYEYIPTEPPIA